MRLRVSDLWFSYGQTPVLRDVSLGVEAGEIVGLIGPNGSGKSTLIKNVFDLVRSRSGEITVDGHPHGSAAAQRAAVHLSSNDHLPQFLTGRELVAMMARLYEVPVDEVRLMRLADDFAMTPRLDDLVEDYSHGMRKKLQLMTALVVRRPLTVIDETMNGVDIEAAHIAERRLSELRGEGSSVLLCSHDLGLLERCADRVVFLDLGELVTSGTTDELVAQHGSLSTMVFDHLGARLSDA